MPAFRKFVQRISIVSVAISGVFLIAMVILVDANIIGRATWGSILGTFELTGLLGCICIAFGIAYTEYHEAHVSIPVLLSLFRPGVQAVMKAIAPVIATIAALTVAGSSTVYLVTRVLPFHNDTHTLEWPVAPFLSVWIIGLLFLCLMLITNFIKAVQGMVK